MGVPEEATRVGGRRPRMQWSRAAAGALVALLPVAQAATVNAGAPEPPQTVLTSGETLAQSVPESTKCLKGSP